MPTHWLAYVLRSMIATAKQCNRHRLIGAGWLARQFCQTLPLNGFHRAQRLLNALFRDTTRILTITQGEAELSSVKISQTYFGQFIGRLSATAWIGMAKR